MSGRDRIIRRLRTGSLLVTKSLHVAVLRLGAGDLVPHVIEAPAARAFDTQIQGKPFAEQFVAVSTANLFASDLHRLIVLVAPRHPAC